MLIIFFVFSITAVILTQSEDVRTDPQGWEKPRTVSPAGVFAKNPAADIRGNLAAAVFEGSSKGNTGIYVSVSVDGGGEFIPPVKIAEFKSAINCNPSIAISRNGEIYVVWYILSEDEANGSIYYVKSADLGITWSEQERITFGMQMEILPLMIFDDRDVLHLFYTAYSGKSFNLFHSIRADMKFTESEPMAELKGNIKGSFFPAVRFYKNNAVVVWQAKEESYVDHIYFVKSDDYGNSWSGIERVTTGKNNNQAPAIEIYNDIIYMVYMNNSEKSWGIYLLKGYKFGSRWDEVPVKISTTNANCFSPDITSGPDSELFISWSDLREQKNRIFYRKYSAKTGELSEERKLSTRQTAGRNPVALGTGKKLVVFWDEEGRIIANTSDIFVSSPVVTSRTHPEDAWSKENAAEISWKKPSDESGIAGFATLLDKNPDTNPTIQNMRYDTSSTLLTGLDDGITYFHIRTIDGAGNMSRTVHYRLQVSSNPLAMPVIVSSTHPESGNSPSKKAQLRWAINDTRRLKGFIFSFSKDTPLKPDKFINDFEIAFDELDDGPYFFNIASVSKTNQVSRIATYSFIVGTEGKIDSDYLKDIAKLDLDKQEKPVKIYTPGIELVFPFGKLNEYDKARFEGIIKPLNIPSGNIDGYSVVIGNSQKVPPERINLKSGIINVSDLADGAYTIGARCRYFKTVNGRKVYSWTSPVYRTFTIRIPVQVSPFDRMYALIKKRIGTSPLLIMFSFACVTFTALYRGYRMRVRFFIKSFNYRMKYFF